MDVGKVIGSGLKGGIVLGEEYVGELELEDGVRFSLEEDTDALVLNHEEACLLEKREVCNGGYF